MSQFVTCHNSLQQKSYIKLLHPFSEA